MKTYFLTVTVLCLFTISVKAQHMHGQMPMSKQNESKSEMPMHSMKASKNSSSLSKVLLLYYDISNALVNGNAALASSKSLEMVKSISEVDMNAFSGKDMEMFMDVQKKLVEDGRKLGEKKDIEEQRNVFADLSLHMAGLIKGVAITNDHVYEITCTMKKANWLSNDDKIRNPYFGKQMLKCGKVIGMIN